MIFYDFEFNLCASGALPRFYATLESSVMLCITIQRNIIELRMRLFRYSVA